MRADPVGRGKSCADERGERGRHGRHGAAEKQSRRQPECEREGGVADRDDAASSNAAGANGSTGETPFMFTWSIGLDHQVTMRLKSPATAMLARPTRASLTVNQRVRVTLCVQASR